MIHALKDTESPLSMHLFLVQTKLKNGIMLLESGAMKDGKLMTDFGVPNYIVNLAKLTIGMKI